MHMLFSAHKHSMHISEDTHAHPNLLGQFPATAEKYIMIITVWVYIPELTRSDTHTHTQNLEVPGAAVVCVDWCTVLEQPGAGKWFVQLLFSIKTSWEQSQQA